MTTNPWLVSGGVLSAIASILHIAIMIGGPDWYRFFGAGERVARAAERGLWTAPAMALGIAAILAIWSAYAFAGAGLIQRLPLMKAALVTISAIYLLRGLVLIPAYALNLNGVGQFTLWSSLIVLIYGLTYAIGTWTAWPKL